MVLTTRQIAKRTGWSRQKVLQLCKSGKLPFVDTSAGSQRKRYGVRESDLDAFLTPTTERKPEEVA